MSAAIYGGGEWSWLIMIVQGCGQSLLTMMTKISHTNQEKLITTDSKFISLKVDFNYLS